MNLEHGGDVAVVGAGLIGLAIAFELAGRGATVRVYDRGEPAHAASWAGAGMLAPYSESVTDQALLELCESSLAEYPGFVRKVREAGGVDAKLHLGGIVHAAFDERELERLTQHAQLLQTQGVRCDLLDRSQTLAAEPWLGARTLGSIVVEGEGSIDNRRLGRALEAACRARDVSIVRVATLRVETDERRVLGVRSDVGFTAAAAVINACGAWAAQLPGVPAHSLPAVEPIKGQMLALAVPVGFVRRATWVPSAYLVPRDDGRLLIGATVERAAFDGRVTADAVHELLHAALAAAPALGGFSISETWAGLRPGTPDGRPFIGPTFVDGLFVASGHYRNGILLAPATARLIADAIEGRSVQALQPFLLARFGTEGSLESRMPAT
jgi:glycine oxidase